MFNNKKQVGELCVFGKSEAKINLRHKKYPKNILVFFNDKEKFHPIPCNPQHHDDLQWSIIIENKSYYLVIKWDVSDIGEIKWKIFW